MNYEYWLDLKETLSKFLSVLDYLLIYLYIFNEKPIHIPNIRFWGNTIFYINRGLKIYDIENGLWTIEGCFREIEELYEKSEGDIDD